MSTSVRFHVRAKYCTAAASRRVQNESRNFISDAVPRGAVRSESAQLNYFVVLMSGLEVDIATFAIIWF